MGVNKSGTRNLLEEYLEDYPNRKQFDIDFSDNKLIITPIDTRVVNKSRFL